MPAPGLLDAIAEGLARLDGLRGLARHAVLVAVLIEAGELAQGVADAAFAARGGRDERSPEADAAMALVSALAVCATASWRNGFAADTRGPSEALAALRAAPLPEEITVKTPEGFAFYALYPEAFAEAGRALAGRDLQVIGLRSIGTTLAAMVAAGADVSAGAGAPSPVTVRPVGHPFARDLALGPALDAELGRAVGREIAVVDEGPGLSGSSMAAVVARLTRLGHRPERVHLFPGHANGPGPQASPAVRAVWSGHATHVATFDEVILRSHDPRHRLSGWVADLVGPLAGPLREVSGGGWRALRHPDEAAWPPVHPWQERRKFLAETREAEWLVKFAGLGRRGTEALARARRLAAAGFSPEPAGLAHGFLVERWYGDARPLDLATLDRGRLLDRLAEYLAFRARTFPAAEPGASPDALLAMASHNAGQALGPEAGRAVLRWRPALPRLAALIRPVETDNRLHAWEWLEVGGRLLKTDAVDHHAGHDLVGCQDIAWDIAGAGAEFALNVDEFACLTRRIRALGVAADPDLVSFMTLAYAAYQLGAWTMTADAVSGAEAARVARTISRYRDALEAALEA